MFSVRTNARGDLVITADAEGREEVMSWERDGYGRNRPLTEVESRLFEALGLEQIGPEEVGALTSAPIVALPEEVERNEEGRLVRLGRVWWFPNYQIEAMTETLRDEGVVTMTEGK